MRISRRFLLVLFILVIVPDEPMFEAVNRIMEKEKSTSKESRSPSQRAGAAELAAFSATVGKKPTLAHAYLDDSPAVVELLRTLSKFAQRDKSKYYSAADLSGIGSLSSESQYTLNVNSGSRHVDSPPARTLVRK